MNALAEQAEMAALRERKRQFDDMWLITLIVVFVALATPWFLHVLEIDLAPIAWSLFGFGAVHIAATLAAEGLHSPRAVLALRGCCCSACCGTSVAACTTRCCCWCLRCRSSPAAY